LAQQAKLLAILWMMFNRVQAEGASNKKWKGVDKESHCSMAKKGEKVIFF
jgi:hypothetical protein